jgi:hypothetical protein
MLNQNLFNYKEERREALACHNIALWYKLFKEEEQEQQARKEYYFQKFLDDDMDRCLGGF